MRPLVSPDEQAEEETFHTHRVQRIVHTSWAVMAWLWSVSAACAQLPSGIVRTGAHRGRGTSRAPRRQSVGQRSARQ